MAKPPRLLLSEITEGRRDQADTTRPVTRLAAGHSSAGSRWQTVWPARQTTVPKFEENRLYHFSVNYDKCDLFAIYGGFE
jgi:hypothetical protein